MKIDFSLFRYINIKTHSMHPWSNWCQNQSKSLATSEKYHFIWYQPEKLERWAQYTAVKEMFSLKFLQNIHPFCSQLALNELQLHVKMDGPQHTEMVKREARGIHLINVFIASKTRILSIWLDREVTHMDTWNHRQFFRQIIFVSSGSFVEHLSNLYETIIMYVLAHNLSNTANWRDSIQCTA